MRSGDCMRWTDDTIRALRKLWSEGHPTAEIGRRLGISKNAVVGKAHRLDLPRRLSPIRTKAAPPAPRRATVPRLADIMPMASTSAIPQLSPPPARPRRTERTAPIAPSPAPTDRRIEANTGNTPCCWPIGDPGTAGFRFCEAPALIGKPYCDAHAQLAYVRARHRNDDHAANSD